MQHTLVAVFDNRSDAQNAMDELLASGFSRTDVNVSSADPTGQNDSLTGTAVRTDDTQEEGFGASIKHFFSGLFGSDSDETASRYSSAVNRGHHVLTVTTQSEPEVERAADVIERFGPVDIDERHDLTGSASTLGASALQQPSSSSTYAGSMQSASQNGAYPPGTEPGALQGDYQEDRNYFATQNLNDPVPKGTTYQEPQGASMQIGSLDSANGGNTLSGSESTSQKTGLSPAAGSTALGTSQQNALGSSGSSLQGTASMPGSSDASLGGTVRTSDSMQRDNLSASQQLDSSLNRDGATAIPVVQEELKVGKREVQRGGVRVFSRVVETPVDQSIGLREEHVSVERRPVNQPIDPSDVTAFKEQSIELRETAEEAVVQKSARVVEEVLVGKEVSQRQEQIHDTVRRTEVEVESLGGDRASMRASSGGNDDYFRNDWNTNYSSLGGSYDDYAPAYKYGNEMRSDDQYRNRNWDDVESDLKSSWDSRNSGGPSTWEKMKAAVRSGWDKITPDADDDNYYRNHFSSTYGTTGDTYNDYQPAYQYGNDMRRNTKYQGRDWNDVESDLRSDWDTRYANGGPSTWDKMKAAVRHGWERMTS
ncbi:DUF2382 domain-containing protein [Massilia forsythiae]|uniref:DUF2382 domain-containing protein n=1 Tax=Massilia forsythiae TaxID=2728020 RepID=A0A7Z2W0P7_9BURK|nr:DUF2382 domain-containing protein [Massilia forsythiae]QJE02285.1 DUF2382 domain-containing protein [Massilia forsythiae]